MPSRSHNPWQTESSHVPEVASDLDHHEKQAEKASSKLTNLDSSPRTPAVGISKNSLSSAFLKSLNSSKNNGNPLPDKTLKSMSKKTGSSFKDVRVHNGKEAHLMNKEINAKAFTYGNDIYFKEGHFQPDSKEGQRLIAHELVHTRQQTSKIHRAPEISAGSPTGNYIFEKNKALPEGFLKLLRNLCSDGPLNDSELDQLRLYSIRNRGSVSQVEKLLMAAALKPALLNTIINGGDRFIISMLDIERRHRQKVRSIGQNSMPPHLIQLIADSHQAINNFNFFEFYDIYNQIQSTAAEAIFAEVENRHKKHAADLIAFAQSKNISLTDVLKAMIYGASDHSNWDKIMSGMTYGVVTDAGHADASKIISGDLKIDALSDSAYQEVVGGGSAAYISFGYTDMQKGDTLYLRKSMSLESLTDRSIIFHEFIHGIEEHKIASNRIEQMNQIDDEIIAYRAQMSYALGQISSAPVTEQDSMIQEFSVNLELPFYRFSLILEAQKNAATYQPIVEKIFKMHNSAYTTANIIHLMSLDEPTLLLFLRLALASEDVYTLSGYTWQDGMKGESINDFVN